MKKLLLTVSLLVLIFAPLVSAQTFERKETVILSKDKVVDENYFALGEAINLSGTVNGDAYLAGGNVTIDGNVNGDLLVGGGSVTIRGNVSQDVRVAGGSITITGKVGGNVTSATGSLTIADSAEIVGSLVSAGGSISVFSPVGKGMTLAGGSATLGNKVGGNILASVGKITLNPEAQVAGNLTYFSNNQASVEKGASISGKITHYPAPFAEKKTQQKARQGFDQGVLVFKFLTFAAAFILGFILIKLAPAYSQQAANQLGKNPLSTLGAGFLTLVLAPLIVLVLVLTVVGIPLAMIIFALYLIEIYFAKIVVSLFVGEKLMRQTKNSSLALSLFVGLLIYYLLTLVPAFGWLVVFLATLSGLGALVLQKKNYYLKLRAKKLI